MLSSASAITEMKSSCQDLSGFLSCPSLSFSTIRPFIGDVLFRQYHGSEAGPWNCLVALHRSARVEWSPGKCQISLVFSNLFTDFSTPWCKQWEEGGAHMFTHHRKPECRPSAEWPTACSGTLSSDSHRDPWLAVPRVTPNTTAFHRTPAASWPVLHPPAP